MSDDLIRAKIMGALLRVDNLLLKAHVEGQDDANLKMVSELVMQAFNLLDDEENDEECDDDKTPVKPPT